MVGMATWVVTGANRGIGLEICRQLKHRGEAVVAACRTSSSELDALGVEVVSGVELSSDDGAAKLAKAVGERRVDVLVNNAGVLLPDALDALDFDLLRK